MMPRHYDAEAADYAALLLPYADAAAAVFERSAFTYARLPSAAADAADDDYAAADCFAAAAA